MELRAAITTMDTKAPTMLPACCCRASKSLSIKDVKERTIRMGATYAIQLKVRFSKKISSQLFFVRLTTDLATLVMIFLLM